MAVALSTMEAEQYIHGGDGGSQLRRGGIRAQCQGITSRLSLPPVMRPKRFAIVRCLPLEHPFRGRLCPNERRDSDLAFLNPGAPDPTSAERPSKDSFFSRPVFRHYLPDAASVA